jgi:hypothetical protein
VPLRLPCKAAQLSPGTLLYPYWGALGFHRPSFDVFLISTAGVIVRDRPRLDTGADHTIFASDIARQLGLPLSFPRQIAISGAAGTWSGAASFPPDGLVSLFVTDYRDYCYLPNPLIGFLSPGPGGASQRSVLGLSGFLQYFRFTLDPSPPLVELRPASTFAGATGPLPKDRGLHEFITGLRGAA